MGWSGETLELNLSVIVDAHGGEREERGDRLLAQLRERCHKAVQDVLADPVWKENEDAIKVYCWWGDD